MYSQDAGAEIVQIRRILKRVSYDVELKLEKGYQKVLGLFLE